MESPTTLLLPIWAQVRELDAKILLACAAAERGIPAILGSRAQLSYLAHRLPRGVYLAKGGQREGTLFRIMRHLGHEIALLDEASLLRLPDQEVRQMRYSERAAARVSLFLAWGEDDARMLRGTPACRHASVRAVGNPRIDLTRPELRPYFSAERQEIQRRFGDFVLLNTNFFGLNHYLPALSTERQIAEGTLAAGEYLRAFARHRLRIFEAFLGLVPELGRALGGHALVVRPHPLESAEPWRRVAAGLPNVHVVQEGNVLPWLLAARVSIANNCTTLVEAHLLGQPGVHYEPARDDALDFALPRLLSHAATRPSDVVQLAASALAGRLAPRESAGASVLGRHLAGLDGALASDRIAEALREHRSAEGRAQSFAGLRWLGAAECVGRALWKRRGGGGSRHDERLHAHRFPTLTKADVGERVLRFAGLLGRFEKLSVERFAEHLFRIAPG